VDEGILDKIFSAASGVWALVAMAAVALFKSWPLVMDRMNERRRDAASEKASDWDRIRVERNELRCLLRECERERVEWHRRAVQAEATLQGYGDALQKAQEIVATERLIDAKKAKKENGE
jgi:hypothetical protein